MNTSLGLAPYSALLGLTVVTCSLVIGLTPSELQAEECWECLEGRTCEWDDELEEWNCWDAAFFDEAGVEEPNGFEDCSDNQSQTWCDADPYAECPVGRAKVTALPE